MRGTGCGAFGGRTNFDGKREGSNMPFLSDGEMRRLEDELYTARRTVLHLVPDHLRDLLRGASTLDEVDHEIPEKVIEVEVQRQRKEIEAEVTARGEAFTVAFIYQYARAKCPLCNSEVQSYNGPHGYTVPEGLRR